MRGNIKKDEYFSRCCAACSGKCCKVGGLYITAQEYKRIPDAYKNLLKKHYFGYVTFAGKQCPFLKNSGCVLEENRFLECKLYPLEIVDIDKLILKPECPHKEHFNNEIFFEKGHALFEKYKKNNLFNKNDLVGIINNAGWRTAEKRIK